MKSMEEMLNGAACNDLPEPVELDAVSLTSLRERLHGAVAAERRRRTTRRMRTLAACLCCVLLVGQTSWAQQLVFKVLQVIRLDSGVELYQTQEPNAPNSMPVPPSLQGKLYTKEGAPITDFTQDIQGVYTVYGERIVDWKMDGTIITESQRKAELAQYPQLSATEEMKGYLCFTPYVPTYLPEGYQLDHIQLFQDKDSDAGEYAHLIYSTSDGKRFTIVQQILTPENLFSTGTSDTMKEVAIRGQRGVEMGGDTLIWEENGVSIQIIAGKSILPMTELYKIAESLDPLS